MAAGALTVLLAHAPSFAHRLLDGDEAIYGTIAALMNLGEPLYGAGGVDNKPPGVFWVYALTFRAFGTYQMAAVHAVALVAMAATCVLIFFIARGIAGPRAGLLAGLFYGVLTAAGNPRLLAANTEIFMMLPLAASVLFMLRRRWFWAGLLVVGGGLFRQSAAVNVILLGLAVFWLEPRHMRARAAGLLIGGMGLGALSAIGLIAATGSLSGFWRWTVETLTGYASTNWSFDLVVMRARDSIVPFVIDMAVLWIVAIALLTRWRTLSVPLRLMCVWLVIAIAGSFAGGHLSWHYFIQAMGPLAVLAGIGFVTFSLGRLAISAAVAGIAIPAAAWWVFNVTADPLTYDFRAPVPQHQAVAAYVASHTWRSSRVFIWGDWPAVYVESDRLMSTRFPGFLRGFARGSSLPPNNWDTTPDVWRLLEADLYADPPTLIIDTSAADWSDFGKYPMSNYPALDVVVHGYYYRVATIDGVVIYAHVD